MDRWLLLVVALVLNAAANVLMKIGANRGLQLPLDTGLSDRLLNFLNWPTLLAILCFAANVLAYRRALEAFDVSVAYPIMVSTGLVLVTLAAVSLPMLNEKVGLVQVLGMALIALGVWLVARG